MFVSVFFVAGVLLVSRACSLDGDVLGRILGGMTVVIGLLGVTTTTQKKSYQSDSTVAFGRTLNPEPGVLCSVLSSEFVHSP